MKKYQPPQSHTPTPPPPKKKHNNNILMLFFAVGSLHVFEMSSKITSCYKGASCQVRDKMEKMIKD